MAEHFLYLTTMGRTSGEERQIEIWFVEYSGNYYVISERRDEANWVKNIANDSRVRISVGSRDDKSMAVPDTAATARVVDASSEPDLARTITDRMDHKYGWSHGLIIELRPES